MDDTQLASRSAPSVAHMLQGAAPGLTISTTSGRPGNSADLNIRGITSINGGSPLVLIDGAEGDLMKLNPNDVASISVIKDASAAAIYGARAAYGVVLVTTKEGDDSGKTRVSYSGRWGWNAPTTSTDYETRGYYSVYVNDLFWHADAGTNYTNYTEQDMMELWARRNDKVENPERPWVKIDQRDGLANPRSDHVTRVSAPYKRAIRLFHPADSVIDCGGVKIGGKEKIAVMAGPCSIEGEEQALRIANGVKAGGASLFRGGAYKPRTSPYSFQGLETEGILDMVKAREATGMPIVSELMSEDRIPEFEEYVDVVQIGARNMQNFQLLKAVGKMHKPVLLKRGLCNTIEEWIMSAEYIMAGGNEQVIFCERGIRTFEKYTRNTLDLSAVPIIHEKTHLPIVVDPSHATGKANLVEPMMIAAVAAGADGLEIEVHYDPQHAWSDGAQCLTPDAFAQAMAKCRQVAWAIGREM